MFGRRYKLFEVSGFPIRIDLSWLVILVLVTWSLAEGVFVQEPTFTEVAGRPGIRWAMGLIGALGLFVSIVLHELGHAKVAERCGMPMRGITLFIFGGVAEMADEPPSAKTEFLVAIAGPIVTLGIVTLCALAAGAAQYAGTPVWLWGVLGYIAFINLVLILFNMVPAFPLDGGRVLRSAIWQKTGDLERATRVSATIGGAFGFVLIGLSLFYLLYGSLIGAIWWLILGLFLRGAAMMSYQRVVLRRMLEGETVARFMHEEVRSVQPGMTLQDVVDQLLYKHHHKLYPVTDQEELIGCLTFEQIKAVPPGNWRTTRVGDVMEREPDDLTTTPTADAMRALEQMNHLKSSRLIVVDGRHVVGMITMRDLQRFFSMKIALEDIPMPTKPTPIGTAAGHTERRGRAITT